MNAPETRERSGAGTRAALIVPAMMSSSIRPTPGDELGGEEAGDHEPLRPAGERDEDQRRGEEEAAERRTCGPMPIRRAIRAVTNEPPSVPTDAAPSTMPSVAGPTSR